MYQRKEQTQSSVFIHCSTSEVIKQHVHEDEKLPVDQAPANVNFGSGIGSPFRSSSTQPSTYGGPAINITG